LVFLLHGLILCLISCVLLDINLGINWCLKSKNWLKTDATLVRICLIQILAQKLYWTC
jgi:hypothetical protein